MTLAANAAGILDAAEEAGRQGVLAAQMADDGAEIQQLQGKGLQQQGQGKGQQQEVYNCGISIVVQGRALVVCLNGEQMHSQISTPHATILYRRQGFNADGYAKRSMVAFRNRWLTELGRNPKGGRCSFTLRRWGRNSDFIEGELQQFILDARSELCEHLGCDITEQRPPHVALRR